MTAVHRPRGVAPATLRRVTRPARSVTLVAVDQEAPLPQDVRLQLQHGRREVRLPLSAGLRARGLARHEPSVVPRPGTVTAAAAATAVVAGSTGSPRVLALVTGLVCLLLLTALPTRALIGLFVASTFVTRYGLSVGGATLRAEYVTGVLLALALLHRYARCPPDARSRALLTMLVAYLGYSTAITMLMAPSPESSATVLAWYLSDCLILLALMRVPDLVRTLVRLGTGVACAHAAFGVAAWLLASAGGPRWFVQDDPAYGGVAAYGLSFEANIFAGVTCIWAVVALASPGPWVARGVRGGLLGLAPVVALVSHTRAALAALAVGVLVLLIARTSGQVRRKVLPVTAGMAALVAAALAVGVPGTDEIANKFAQSFDVNTPNARIRIDNNAVALADLDPTSTVLGLGTNTYGQRHVQRAPDGSLVPSYVGSLPLQVLYDTGLVGLAVLTIGLVRASRRRLRPGLGNAVLAALLTMSLSTSFFWFATTWVFLLIGCSDLVERVDPGDPSPDGSSGARPQAVRAWT